MKKELYVKIWEDNLPWILEAIKKGGDEKVLNKESFYSVGNRNKSGYNFRLDIKGVNVPTKKGTAVARDLKDVLDRSDTFKQLASGKNLVIRMGKNFDLYVMEG